MFGFVSRRRLQLLLFAAHNATNLTSANPQLGFLQNFFSLTLRSLSTSLSTRKHEEEEDESRQKDCSFTVSYLINTCGLSPKSAKSASKNIILKNSQNPNAVISLFKDYGLTKSHISKIVMRDPRLLLAKPKVTLFPKLEFFRSIGFSSSDLGRILSKDALLSRSLEGCIIPCYNMVKNILLSDEKVVRCMKRFSWFSWSYFPKNLDFNLSLLRELGVPQSVITYLVVHYPDVVSGEPDRTSQSAKKAVEIGCDPSQYSFASALHVIYHTNWENWERKTEVFCRCGLSEEEILTAFKKNPLFMSLSEKKIMKTMDFLVNTMGYKPTAVLSVPTILCYSFEQRIFSRCSVFRILLFKGLVKPEISLYTILKKTEDQFLDMFVMKYQKEVPQLLSILQGKMSIAELGFEFEEKCRTKNLK